MKRLLAVLLLAALLPGCGEEDPPPYKGDPTKLKGAPPPLAELHKQASELLDGGADAFKARLKELRGYPVVVNKWASWCGPCRHEFPFLQKQSIERGKEVAFLGVDSDDNDGDAADFLKRYPVSYPTYKDPDLKVSLVFKGHLAWPSTAYYSRQGEVLYLKHGYYKTEEDFVADLDRYTK